MPPLTSSGDLDWTLGGLWLMTAVMALSMAPLKAWSPTNTVEMSCEYFWWTLNTFSTKSVACWKIKIKLYKLC